MTNGNGRANGHTPAPMSGELFAEYMEKRLTIYDQIELISRNGMELQLRVAGQDITADLTSFYEAYVSHPERIDDIAQTLVRVLSSGLPDRTEQSFAELSDRVFPMLKPIGILAEVRERNLPMLAYREFLADLIITYVIDETRSVTFLNEDHLERWSVSVQDLHEQAIENLRRRTQEDISYVTAGSEAQRLFIFNSNDGYDATRLLLAELLAEWGDELPGHMVIGIPNRDFLIAFSDSDPEVLSNVARQIQADAAQHTNGLTDQLFTLEQGQVREYQWE